MIMKNIFSHLKTSGIMTGSGMVSYYGGQLVTTSIKNMLLSTVTLFILMVTMGVVSKLVLDKVNPPNKPS